MALRYQGFEVAVGRHRRRRARRGPRLAPPHVIVLDVMLPDMDGFEVARRLAAERAEVPILFLSARDHTADKVRGLTTGGDDYVTKPFSLEELIARLRNILRRSGALRGADEPAALRRPRARRGHARGHARRARRSS